MGPGAPDAPVVPAPVPAPIPADPAGPPPRPAFDWTAVLKTAAIWTGFLLLVYLARDFFFTAFLTFLFSYLTLTFIAWVQRRFFPRHEGPGLQRLLTVAVFLVVPALLLMIGLLLGPSLLSQGQRLAGWLSQVSPETEAARVLEEFVGAWQFKEALGGPDDPRYRQALDDFRATGEHQTNAYLTFPHLESWVEGGFARQFAETQRGRVTAHLAHEGTSSKEFADWFLATKVPQLKDQAARGLPHLDSADGAADPLLPLLRAAPSSSPEKLLDLARHDFAALAVLRRQWIQDAVPRAVAEAKNSPAYRRQLQAHYDQLRHDKGPDLVPYTFEQYLALRQARPAGPQTFADTLDKLLPASPDDTDARLRADFEAAQKHELFQQWWGSNPVAAFLRRQLARLSATGDAGGRVENALATLLNVPLALSTALLLSFFICIDFPRLRQGVRALQDTWLKDAYHTLANPLYDLTQLVGRALYAQGLIALCNALALFVALTLLGVEHAVFLALAVFVFCLVPTLGTLIAWTLIVTVALIQPGGGLLLALKVSGAVLAVILLETFVFSPRILGRMMDLHPVVLIALLPLAQYFFGVWGLILATPVAVYVVHHLVLAHGLPGRRPSGGTAADQHS